MIKISIHGSIAYGENGAMVTDNEIIKALQCCKGHRGVSFCINCPLFVKGFNTLSYELLGKGYCVNILSREAYNLINQQKKEIERLNLELKIAKGE